MRGEELRAGDAGPAAQLEDARRGRQGRGEGGGVSCASGNDARRRPSVVFQGDEIVAGLNVVFAVFYRRTGGEVGHAGWCVPGSLIEIHSVRKS